MLKRERISWLTGLPALPHLHLSHTRTHTHTLTLTRILAEVLGNTSSYLPRFKRKHVMWSVAGGVG